MLTETRRCAVRVVVCIVLGVWLAGAAKEPQYKQLARDDIARMVDGDVRNVFKRCRAYLEEHPDDLESLYCLAAAHARNGELEEAMAYVRRAVEAGLPFGRFLAGPRDLLKPLTESDPFKAFAAEHPVTVLHGPTLGCVTDHSATIWVRTGYETTVQVLVGPTKDLANPIASAVVRTDKEKDYTAVAFVEGLKPNTRYHYALVVDGTQGAEQWCFSTFPPAGSHAAFEVGFGGGGGYTPKHERMWNTLIAHKLPAFLFLGDNVYIDHPTYPAVQQYCYYRRQSRPEFRGFAAQAGLFAIWDDHDFTTNDAGGGPEVDTPAWKIPVWRLFMNNWNNPSYGGGETQPGCWFSFSIADVDFFMLDGRYYRTPANPRESGGRARVEHPSMLGPVQKRWLFEALKKSTGVFKVIASPVPWAYGAKPGSLDPWQGYRDEREEIFSFLEENRIGGVILISADRHRSDAWKIERPNGYDLYEFESSRLTNIHTHDIMAGSLFGYNETCSFGLLHFDTTKADPEVTYQIVSIDNEVIRTLTLERSALEYK